MQQQFPERNNFYASFTRVNKGEQISSRWELMFLLDAARLCTAEDPKNIGCQRDFL
jgi:hypothetical protein